jgi:hypothetical protein
LEEASAELFVAPVDEQPFLFEFGFILEFRFVLELVTVLLQFPVEFQFLLPVLLIEAVGW